MKIEKKGLPDHMDKEIMAKRRVQADKVHASDSILGKLFREVDKQVYASDSILGKLFREVDKHLILDEFL